MTGSLAHARPGSDRVAELAREHPSLVALARAGWMAKGVVYGLVGILAVPIAVSGLRHEAPAADDEASQSGAVAEIAEHRFGALVLSVVAAGLALYVLWRLVSILLPASNSLGAWATRGGYAVSVVVYSTLAWSAVSLARHSGAAAESEDSRVDHVAMRWRCPVVGYRRGGRCRDHHDRRLLHPSGRHRRLP